MKRILDITAKDLRQIIRNRMTFLFLLIMPAAFTILFGLAFGGSGKATDTRLPVGMLDQDGGSLSEDLKSLLAASSVIRLDEKPGRSEADLISLVASDKLAAAVVIPPGYSQSLRSGNPLKLGFHADPAQASTITIESELLVASQRLGSAVRTANITASMSNDPTAFDPALAAALAAWQNPPIQVVDHIRRIRHAAEPKNHVDVAVLPGNDDPVCHRRPADGSHGDRQ